MRKLLGLTKKNRCTDATVERWKREIPKSRNRGRKKRKSHVAFQSLPVYAGYTACWFASHFPELISLSPSFSLLLCNKVPYVFLPIGNVEKGKRGPAIGELS